MTLSSRGRPAARPRQALAVVALLGITPAQGVSQDISQALSAIAGARSVRIVDEWIGLSPASPTKAEYELQRVDGELRGIGRFSVGPEDGELTDSAEVVIPAQATSAFLSQLSSVEPRQGVYEPSITHTDDFPRLSISVSTSAGELRCHSESQGPGHVPWGLEFQGQGFIIESRAPDDALSLVKPYLRLEKLKVLIDRAWQR